MKKCPDCWRFMQEMRAVEGNRRWLCSYCEAYWVAVSLTPGAANPKLEGKHEAFKPSPEPQEPA